MKQKTIAILLKMKEIDTLYWNKEIEAYDFYLENGSSLLEDLYKIFINSNLPSDLWNIQNSITSFLEKPDHGVISVAWVDEDNNLCHITYEWYK